MSKAWAKGSTTRWRKTRALILANNRATNQGRCTLQIPGVCTGPATQVHHTLGRSVTGDDPAHLQATCAECNYKVGDPTRPPKGTPSSPKPRPVTRW